MIPMDSIKGTWASTIRILKRELVRVTLKATDSQGNSGTNTIEIKVIK